jgi:hypothetical protein
LLGGKGRAKQRQANQQALAEAPPRLPVRQGNRLLRHVLLVVVVCHSYLP